MKDIQFLYFWIFVGIYKMLFFYSHDKIYMYLKTYFFIKSRNTMFN